METTGRWVRSVRPIDRSLEPWKGFAMVAELSVAARLCVGLVFLAAAVSKVRNQPAWQAFERATARLSGPVPANVNGAVSRVVIVAELAVGPLVGWSATAVLGLMLAGLLTLTFTAASLIAADHGSEHGCGCFGTSTGQPLWLHLVRNAFLLLAVIAGLWVSVPAAAGTTAAALGLGIGGALFIVGSEHAYSLLRKDL